MKAAGKRSNSPNESEDAGSRKRRRGDDGNENEETAPTSEELRAFERARIIRNGKVLKMVLKNFMCHRHLAVEFNTRANLLVGKNGSGKSAILAAMTIGLGCTAGQTNRCSKVKDLIKHGQTQAIIEIHLENSGFDAFEKDRYGDRIICERTITASGTGSYKLKNEDGKTVSTRRADLQKILLAFNIQVDNPVCVLNQDMARSLLRDSDECKQYQFFMKATQIESIKQKLHECSTIAERARNVLNLKEQSLRLLITEIKALEEKRGMLESAEKMADILQNLQVHLAWRNVFDQEQQQAVLDAELQRVVEAIEKENNKIENRAALVAEADKTIVMYRESIESRKSHYVTLKETYATARNRLQSIIVKEGEVDRNVKRNADRLLRMTKDFQQMQHALEERAKDGPSPLELEKKRIAEETARLGDRKTELTAMIENAQRDLDMMHRALDQQKEVREEKHLARLAKQSEADRIDKQLQQFESSPRNKLPVYGASMPALDARIQQLYEQGKFSERPRGPLGQYIEVRNKKWSSIIETTLGGCLAAFFVATQEDWCTLNGLLKREFPELQNRAIFTGRFVKQLYDVQQGSVQELDGTHLLMNLIKVKDPVVMNRLIDSASIDTILVTEQQSIAIEITSKIDNVPQYLSKIIVSEPCSEFYPQPKYRSYGLQPKPPRFLQTSMGELKRQTQQRKDELQRELVALSRAVEEEQGKLKEKSKTLHQKQELLKRLRQDLIAIEQRLQQLSSAVFIEETEEATLRSELKVLDTDRTNMEESIQQEQANLDDIRKEMLSQKRTVQEKKEALTAIEAEIAETQKKIDVEDQKRRDLQTNHKVKINALARSKETMRELQERLKALTASVESRRQQALAKGERPEEGELTETTGQIKAKIHSTEKQIRKANVTQEKLEDVNQELEGKLNERNEMERFTTGLSNITKLLHYTRESRLTYLNKLISHMTLRIKHKFKSILQIRNYDGEIRIDRDQFKLALSVIPRDKNKANAVSATKSLSGGERSYATVAFLTSLWSCVDVPFFFLDEYDVFTDDVTRHTITRLLLHEASMKPDRQFCFLTPQDMGDVQAKEDLTIFRMEDPVRC